MSRRPILGATSPPLPRCATDAGIGASRAGGGRGLTRGRKCGSLPNGCLIADAEVGDARSGARGDRRLGPTLLAGRARRQCSGGSEAVGQSKSVLGRSYPGDRNGGSLPNPHGAPGGAMRAHAWRG
jgi:hypothetical protein